MILLDRNNEPENTIYYISALLYGLINNNPKIDYSRLYKKLLAERKNRKININFFSLALDFLFLLDKISINSKGGLYVIKNSKNN